MRFRYSLRTLLIVVTILAIGCWYVAEQYRIVQARQRLMEGQVSHLNPFSPRTAEISWLRKILGDEGHPAISVDAWVSEQEMERVQSLFPEAQLYRADIVGAVYELQLWSPPQK